MPQRRKIARKTARARVPRMNPFEQALDRGPANYAPLTPLSFLARAATVYPGKPAVINGDRVFTYADLYARCRPPGLGAQAARDPSRRHGGGDGAQCPGAPRGPVRRPHGGAKLLMRDREFSETVGQALGLLAWRRSSTGGVTTTCVAAGTRG